MEQYESEPSFAENGSRESADRDPGRPDLGIRDGHAGAGAGSQESMEFSGHTAAKLCALHRIPNASNGEVPVLEGFGGKLLV